MFPKDEITESMISKWVRGSTQWLVLHWSPSGLIRLLKARRYTTKLYVQMLYTSCRAQAGGSAATATLPVHAGENLEWWKVRKMGASPRKHRSSDMATKPTLPDGMCLPTGKPA